MSEYPSPFSNAEAKSRAARENGSSRPGGHKTQREPPVAPARVAALKANYKQAWLWFLLIISLLVAWGIPIRYAVMRYLAFRPAPTGPRDAHAFVALAYEGISDNPREVSVEQFRQHLAALRRAGYNPITLRDVHAFYSEGKPLPRRAILMSFDHARKSSYFDARSPLASAGWPAVMFLWTQPVEDRDPSALRWPYVRAMLGSGAWEVGAQSHLGFSQVTANSDGTRRNFMTSPQWIASEMRFEPPEAFSQRLQADHEFTRNLIVSETNRQPRAFAFPYGDFGQFDERAILSRRLNLDLVSKYYDLGFIHGTNALNTRFTDPRRLNRLLVQRDWTGDNLVERLENAWPREQGIRDLQARTTPLAWLPDWGHFALENREIVLAATEQTTGAKAWMNGSDLFGDFHARFRVTLEKGQFGIFLRGTPDGESHLFFGLGDNGEVWLRQKHTGMSPFTLATARYGADHEGEILLELDLRGRLFSAKINGRPLFQEVVSVRGTPRPGMMGLSVWDPAPGAARANIRLLEVQPLQTRLLTWAPLSSREPGLAAWMNTHATRYTHLSPPWLRVSSRTHSEQLGWDPELYRMFADVYSMRFTPEIRMENLDNFDPTLPDRLADFAAGIGADGIYCNLSELQGAPPLSRITNWIQALSQSLRERDLQLMIRLSPALERESTFSALLQSLPELHIIVQDTPLNYFQDSPRERARIVTIDSAVIRPGATTFQVQLTGLDTSFKEWETEVRSRLLREQGQEAFNAGRFEDALEIWARWSELEPYNAEPLRLRGDVHARRSEFNRAIEFYRASLDRSPGQIPLVVLTARLLDVNANQSREAMDMLNLYGRLFPGNPEILLARAEALIRRNRRDEATALITRVIENDPEDLNARVLLHGLLATPRKRIDNLNAIKTIGARPGMEPHFASAIQSNHLLVWPESWRLMDHIEKQAARETTTEDGPAAFSALLPRDTVVRENFTLGRMSDNWNAFSETDDIEDGGFLLAATAATAEAVLQLNGSTALHSAFLESAIEDARGFFWLYARRGDGTMLRYGFDQTGQLFLQLWQNERLISNTSRFWTRPIGVTRLRLEIRGDAAFGFINDEPAFGAPIRIPDGFGLGWWGISPWAPDFGVAQVILREVAGGPLPVRVAIFPPRPEDLTDAELLNKLRLHTRELQAISPQWYVQETNGRVRIDVNESYPNLRMLTRFHHIRLMPGVRAASHRTLDLEQLADLAQEHNLYGFTLYFARMPPQEWFDQADDFVADKNLSLLAVHIREYEGEVDLREVTPHIGLFPGSRRIRTLPIQRMNPDQTQPGNGEISEPDTQTDEAADPSSTLSDAPAPITFPPPPDKVLLF
ncbi:MAG: tetratricopeptide repeat protein [Verrucomicrobia bacterium]|nr:tetratricopeptide repeat protein [Verrucomicrobiota bacterium]MCH8525985.1 polysaccharide deacetylase family protein [Kiritimatiellia bacterium]